MQICNIMEGGGICGSYINLFLLWFGIAIAFMLAAILRRQCDDGFLSGTGFNFIGALVCGIGLSLLIAILTGDIRWTLLAGIVGDALGGFVVGMVIDSGGSEGGFE